MPSSSLPGAMACTSSPTKCTGCWSTTPRPASRRSPTSTSAGFRSPACPSHSPCRGCGSAGWSCGTRICWRAASRSTITRRSVPLRRARSSGSWRCGRKSRSSPATWRSSGVTGLRWSVLRPARRTLHLAAAAGRLDRLPAAPRRTARGRVLPGCAGPARCDDPAGRRL